MSDGKPDERDAANAFRLRVAENQRALLAGIRSTYDFIVCGAGSSGSVVARRLAEDSSVNVLLLEAGGSDEVPNVMQPPLWPTNLASERVWSFTARPNRHLNGRAIPMAMGKVLGGGSSVNGMSWARGHKADWDHFAAEAGDEAWGYDAVLQIYRRSIEDWHGAADPKYRGSGGPMFLQPMPSPSPLVPAMLEGARSIGIPTFEHSNGPMMEGDGGASTFELIVREGQRQSVFRSYVYPYMDRPNLTVLTGALVTRVTFEARRATGVEVRHGGGMHRFAAAREVVLSLGAIHTPKVLMQSGIGDEEELRTLGLPVVQHLPGVGQNFQDHFMVACCMWEPPQPLPPPHNGTSEATAFWKSHPAVESPDLQMMLIDFPYVSPGLARFAVPKNVWGILPCVVRPASRGRLRLSGPNADDPIEIEANTLSAASDLTLALRGVELCREIGNSAAMRPFVKREVMPAGLTGAALEDFVRDGALSIFHQTCTAKMGRDPMSVVDGRLCVYGVQNLRVADGSIMPRVIAGNTMASCVVIGERAASLLRAQHGTSPG